MMAKVSLMIQIWHIPRTPTMLIVKFNSESKVDSINCYNKCGSVSLSVISVFFIGIEF